MKKEKKKPYNSRYINKVPAGKTNAMMAIDCGLRDSRAWSDSVHMKFEVLTQ